MIEDYLTRETPLPFEIELIEGSKIKKVGDVETYLRNLNDTQHLNSHWGIAVRMFANAMQEPAYLKAATWTVAVKDKLPNVAAFTADARSAIG